LNRHCSSVSGFCRGRQITLLMGIMDPIHRTLWLLRRRLCSADFLPPLQFTDACCFCLCACKPTMGQKSGPLYIFQNRPIYRQESCAVAKMTARCALYMGALNIRDFLTTPTDTIPNIFYGRGLFCSDRPYECSYKI